MCSLPKGFTELRKKILETVKASESAITADEVLESVRPEQPDLSTIYRALGFLEKKGYIKSVVFDCSTRFYHLAEDHPVHFLHCMKCHRTQTFNKCFADQIENALEQEHDFRIVDHVFYFLGVCSDCRNTAAQFDNRGGKS
ncbi:MAG TPA: transcriptional repressor [Kosmotogaceae bacterium]|nr:transcriptional repressor [Kosmotogaceae bacterium]